MGLSYSIAYCGGEDDARGSRNQQATDGTDASVTATSNAEYVGGGGGDGEQDQGGGGESSVAGADVAGAEEENDDDDADDNEKMKKKKKKKKESKQEDPEDSNVFGRRGITDEPELMSDLSDSDADVEEVIQVEDIPNTHKRRITRQRAESLRKLGVNADEDIVVFEPEEKEKEKEKEKEEEATTHPAPPNTDQEEELHKNSEEPPKDMQVRVEQEEETEQQQKSQDKESATSQEAVSSHAQTRSASKAQKILGMPEMIGSRRDKLRSVADVEDEPLSPAPPKDETPQQRNARLRRRVLRELVSTERTYVSSLETLVQVYMNPFVHVGLKQDPVWLEMEEIQTVFSNVETICELNKKFLSDLEQRITKEKSENVGDLLLSFAPYFKMYNLYVSNHEHATRFLSMALTEKPKAYQPFINALSTADRNPRSKGNNIQSFLIMPIQRIPRLQLLTQEIIKRTEEGHQDLPLLKQALQKIKDTANVVNAAVRQQQQNAKVLELQQQFAGGNVELVSPGRYFIKFGQLKRTTRTGSKKKYFFFLFNDLLLYASRTLAANGWKYAMHLQIPIDTDFSVIETEPEDGFTVVSHVRSFQVSASSEEEKQEWLTALNECIEAQKKNNLQRQSSLASDDRKDTKLHQTAPIMEQFANNKTCFVCETSCTFLNRRHCKACGHVVHSDCSKNRMVLEGFASAQTSSGIVRVCDKCHTRIKTEREQELMEKMSSPPMVPERPDGAAVKTAIARHLSDKNIADGEAAGGGGRVRRKRQMSSILIPMWSIFFPGLTLTSTTPLTVSLPVYNTTSSVSLFSLRCVTLRRFCSSRKTMFTSAGVPKPKKDMMDCGCVCTLFRCLALVCVCVCVCMDPRALFNKGRVKGLCDEYLLGLWLCCNKQGMQKTFAFFRQLAIFSLMQGLESYGMP